jgi:hypothetical protein
LNGVHEVHNFVLGFLQMLLEGLFFVFQQVYYLETTVKGLE